MLKVGFLPNETKDIGLVFTKDIVDFIVEKNENALLSDRFGSYEQIQASFCSEEELFQNADFVVALGGDGTVLRWAQKACRYEKNLLGINLGTLGYLTDVEKEGALQALESVLKGHFKIEKRMMLEMTFEDKNEIALNDIYISKGLYSKMLKLVVYVNDEYIDTYSADGIVFATPTGSTGYSLSAGGPILKPDAQMIAITPICPHTLYARPFVVSAHDVIRVMISDNQGIDVVLSADGENKGQMTKGSSLTIKRSDFYTSIIKTTDLGFYDILRRKMVNMGRKS